MSRESNGKKNDSYRITFIISPQHIHNTKRKFIYIRMNSRVNESLINNKH